MENKIFTLSDLQKEGKHIAKLAANRNIRTKVVAKKKKSLHANGQAIPAVIVKATSAIEQGYAVLDFETNASVMPEQAAEYVVIVDGAHRYQAHLELLKDSKANYAGEFYFIYPPPSTKTRKLANSLPRLTPAPRHGKAGTTP